MKSGNGILSSYGTTIFEVVSGLAREHGAVNLGQGAPEGMEPADVVARAAQAILDGPNQYPPLMGTPGLRRAVAAHEKRFYGLDVDWESEVMVTSGATGALADALFGLIEEGDEIILLEPLYDSYLPIIRRAGGVPRLVRLAPPDWTLPRDRLAAAFSPCTKAILLNSPANPCGKVYTEDELDFIARLVRDHDAYAICDEVYEHLVFDGRKHIPLMTRPGMRDRCVRIASAGKIFSVTGWKIGMLVAAPDLLRPIIKAHQFLTFTVPPNFQTAVAYGLEKEDGYFTTLIQDMQARRDRLAAGLAGVGFRVLPCGGSYFLTADIGALGNADDDVAFCRRMTIEAGVAAVPVSAFHTTGEVNRFVRFCFAKSDATLTEALARLNKYFG
ncbi:MAG: aminotransferase [Alphaproteobacteria bacterium]|nr:aminotransferase [Alphaproteobacteria bacterium]